jgi:hypothetical protein
MEIKSQIFKFPIDKALTWLEHMLNKIKSLDWVKPYPLEEAVHLGSNYKSINPDSEEYTIEHFKFSSEIEGELSTYYAELEAIRNQLLSDEHSLQLQESEYDAGSLIESEEPERDTNSLTKHYWIKTNLSVENIAAFFKSIYKYYPDPDTKPIKDYRTKRDFHRAVISSFLPIGEKQITLGSYESSYGSKSIEQIKAAEKVHFIFLNCVKAVEDYIDAMEEENDKKK